MTCQNPFFHCKGKSNRIALIIRLKDKDHEICEECWELIADSRIEWGPPLPKLVEIKSPLGTPSLTEKFYGE